MDFVSKTVGKLVQRSIDRHMGAGLMQELVQYIHYLSILPDLPPVPGDQLAEALNEHLTEEHITRMIERCDSDRITDLVQAVSSHLKGNQAGSILRNILR